IQGPGYGYRDYHRDNYYYRGHDRDRHRDRDHDGIPDRYDRDRDNDGVPNRYDRDRDGDGVPNRYDRRPDNPHRRCSPIPPWQEQSGRVRRLTAPRTWSCPPT